MIENPENALKEEAAVNASGTTKDECLPGSYSPSKKADHLWFLHVKSLKGYRHEQQQNRTDNWVPTSHAASKKTGHKLFLPHVSSEDIYNWVHKLELLICPVLQAQREAFCLNHRGS